MKLEDQVCSLGQAKRLKELGVNQDSFVYWIKHNKESSQYCLVNENGFDKSHLISAFTSAELGYLLPNHLITKSFRGKWILSIILNHLPKGGKIFKDDTEAKVRAETLIYLIENGIVKCS